MADVFVSYANEDRARVAPMVSCMHQAGYSVFWNERIPSGIRYRKKIKDELDAASCVFVVWSLSSIESEWVEEEAEEGRRRNILVPVTVDGVIKGRIPPFGFRSFQTTDLSRWDGNYAAPLWQVVLDALTLHLGQPAGKSGILTSDNGSEAPISQKEPIFPLGTEFYDHRLAPQMVVMPQGQFWMGSPANERERYSSEGPQHKVTIKHSFAVGKYPVTLGEWNAAVADGGCGGYKPEYYGAKDDNMPVTNISWNDAQAYIAWLSKKAGTNYRLLSESEWEYCCRSGSTTRYVFGDTIYSDQANFGSKSVTPVGEFPGNSFGLQ